MRERLLYQVAARFAEFDAYHQTLAANLPDAAYTLQPGDKSVADELPQLF